MIDSYPIAIRPTLAMLVEQSWAEDKEMCSAVERLAQELILFTAGAELAQLFVSAIYLASLMHVDQTLQVSELLRDARSRVMADAPGLDELDQVLQLQYLEGVRQIATVTGSEILAWLQRS